MKLAIFGATGRTGRLLVEQALAAGHEVTILVRNPSKVTTRHEKLTVVQGDATNPQQVEKVIEGQDAVLNVLGPTKGAPDNFLATAAENIVRAMQKHGVRRLVSLIGAGIPDPNDQPKISDQIIRLLFKLPIPALQKIYKDSLGHAEQIKNSGLEWVIVRVPRLTEEPRKGQYRVGYVDKNSGLKLGRADLADFMLKQVSSDQYLHKLPAVSY
jgi:putative NADH-flavin reductase